MLYICIVYKVFRTYFLFFVSTPEPGKASTLLGLKYKMTSQKRIPTSCGFTCGNVQWPTMEIGETGSRPRIRVEGTNCTEVGGNKGVGRISLSGNVCVSAYMTHVAHLFICLILIYRLSRHSRERVQLHLYLPLPFCVISTCF